MADEQEDKDVSRRYRELGRDEPPASLDVRIRAEARSALETHAAPLVPPTGRRRWYFPVAAAAVIMLAVAVTSQVEREQSTDAVVTTPQQMKAQSAPAEKQNVEEAKPQQPARKVAPLAKETERPSSAPAQTAPAAPEPRPFAQEPKDEVAADSRIGGAAAGRREDSFTRDNRARQERPASPPASPPAAAEREAQSSRSRADAAPEGRLKRGAPPLYTNTPELWLKHIAELRTQGRHEEADKELEAFRKVYPGFAIPPAMLEKVEKR